VLLHRAKHKMNHDEFTLYSGVCEDCCIDRHPGSPRHNAHRRTIVHCCVSSPIAMDRRRDLVPSTAAYMHVVHSSWDHPSPLRSRLTRLHTTVRTNPIGDHLYAQQSAARTPSTHRSIAWSLERRHDPTRFEVVRLQSIDSAATDSWWDREDHALMHRTASIAANRRLDPLSLLTS
jgi:hypothetical protein